MTALDVYLARRKRNPFGQFGQGHDVSSWDGATGCGHTSVQTVIAAFKGLIPTHDAISKVAGYWRPKSRIGTSAEQLEKALRHWSLAYDATYGATFETLLKWANERGPVLACVKYSRYPAWRLYRHRSTTAPYAQPAGHAGRNQFGVDFAHWVVIVGTMKAGPFAGWIAVMEPNHDSPARPERVVIDYVRPGDLKAAVNAAFAKTIAVVPSRSIVPKPV